MVVALRGHLSGNFSPQVPIYRNDLIIFPVVLHRWHSCSVHWRYLCECSPFPHHMKHGWTTADTCQREICKWANAEDPCIGKSSKSKINCIPNWVTILDQTWVGGNTISDLLITSSMLFHVSSFHQECCVRDHPELSCSCQPHSWASLGLRKATWVVLTSWA